MPNIFIVYSCSFDGDEAIGAYSTQERANDAVRRFAERENQQQADRYARDKDLEGAYSPEEYQDHLLTEQPDSGGVPAYADKHHNGVRSAALELDAPYLV